MSDMGGGMLGLGIIVSLHDAFSGAAKRLERQMKALGQSGAAFAAQWNRSMSQFKTGAGLMAAGIVTLAAISFPVMEAAKFQLEMTRVSTIIDKNIKLTKSWNTEWKKMQSDTLDMGAKFGESPEAHAKALYSVIAKGYDDKPEKAKELLKVANMMSIATDTPVTTSVEGFLSIMNSYGIGNAASVTPQQAGVQYMKAADQIFKAMAIGGFSSNPEETDFEAISRSIGKIAPMASTIGLDFGSLMSTWAVSTQGGQNAATSATGIRQLFKDLITPTKKLDKFTQATGWDQEKMIASIRSSGSLIPLLTKVREYAGFTTKDMEGLSSALKNPEISRRFKELAASADGAKGLMDSAKGREFVRLLSDAGGIDILKVNDVFKSIWGMTAVLPLLTTQFSTLADKEKEVRNAAGLTQQAFDEMSQTVKQRAKVVGSSWQALMVVIGTPLLAPVATALKMVSDGLNTIRHLAERFPFITSVIFKTITAAALLMTVLGTILAVVGIWGMASRMYAFHIGRMTWATRVFGATLNVAFLRIIGVVGLVMLASGLLQKAWSSDFLGMRTTIMGWYNVVKTTIGAVLEAWKAFRETGKFSISEETYKSLQKSGLLGLVGNIIAITYRLYIFGKGFIKGWTEGWKAIGDAARNMFNTIKPGLDALGKRFPIIKTLTNWLSKLFDPTPEGVERWRKAGEVFGKFAAGLVFFTVVIAPVIGFIIKFVGAGLKIISVGWQIIRIVGLIAGHIIKLGVSFLIGLGPIGWAIAAIIAIGVAFYFAWKNNFLGIRDILTTFGHHVVRLFNMVKAKLIYFATEIFPRMKQAASEKWATLKTWFGYVKTAILLIFVGIPRKMWAVGSAFFGKLKEGATFSWNITKIWLNHVGTVIKTIFNRVVSNLKVIGGAMFNGLRSGAFFVWNGLKNWFTVISKAIVALFNKLPGGFKNIGRYIISGLKAGAVEKWQAVKDWFVNSGSWIINKFKEMFGIKSPSTVFKGIGHFIMEGLSLGLDKGWEGIKEKLSGFWDSIKEGAGKAWDLITGGGNGFGGIGGTGGVGGTGYSGPYNPGKSGGKLGLDGVNPTSNDVVQTAISGLSSGWTESIAGFCSRWVRQVMGRATNGGSNRLFGSTAKASERLWQSAGLTKTMAELGGAKGLKPGDVLFQGFGSGGAGHVGIYLGNGRVAENSTRYGTRDARGVTDLAHFGTITSVGRYPGLKNEPEPDRLGVPPNIRAAKEQMLAIARQKDSEGSSKVTSGEMERIEAYLKHLTERPNSTTLKVDSKTLAKVVHGQQSKNARTGGTRPAATAQAGGKR